MSGQEQRRPQRSEDEPDDGPAPPPAAPQVQIKDDDVDAILDEIDGVLENNAEAFVKGYVQKGGQ
jgi:ubiquitin-like protein Pup